MCPPVGFIILLVKIGNFHDKVFESCYTANSNCHFFSNIGPLEVILGENLIYLRHLAGRKIVVWVYLQISI